MGECPGLTPGAYPPTDIAANPFRIPIPEALSNILLPYLYSVDLGLIFFRDGPRGTDIGAFSTLIAEILNSEVCWRIGNQRQVGSYCAEPEGGPELLAQANTNPALFTQSGINRYWW